MRSNWMIACLMGVGLLVLAGPVFAHHGIAAYQSDKQITITGIVTAFDFTNPHALVYVNIKQPDGATVNWEGELTSPNILTRVGWTRRTLRPGQQITLTGFPAKNGESSIWINKVVKSDGTELPVTIGKE